jgi:hypothetical protein
MLYVAKELVMDQLFLLKPGFADPASGSELYYCPYSAAITGVLSYYPRLKKELHVQEVDFPRPREPIAALLGEQHPGCPVLVLDEGRAVPPGIKVQSAPTGRRYISETAEIRQYLARAYGTDFPHP